MKPGLQSFPVRQELLGVALSLGTQAIPLGWPMWEGNAYLDPADASQVILLQRTIQITAFASTQQQYAWGSKWNPTNGQYRASADASPAGIGYNSIIAMGLDGTLYNFGGWTAGSAGTNTGARALTLGGSWTNKTNMPTAVGNAVACALADGRILVLDYATTTAQLFTPGSPGSWAAAAAAPAAINGNGTGAWLLPNGHILVKSGANWYDYDPGGNSWSSPARMNLSSSTPSAQVDAQGRIWMVRSGTLQNYSLAADVLTDTGVECMGGVVCPLQDGRVAIFGVMAGAPTAQNLNMSPKAIQIVSAG